MARYQVILSYDGTGFCGFQRQAKDRKGRSLQAEFEAALSRIGWQGKSILAAGRTDTGVHAQGQVVAFDLEWRHTLQDLRAALNANLPSSMAVRTAAQVRENFHPRYDALSRRYQYRIFCQESRDPLRDRFSWRIWPAADFTAFAKICCRIDWNPRFFCFWHPAPDRRQHCSSGFPFNLAGRARRAGIRDPGQCVLVPYGTETGRISSSSRSWDTPSRRSGTKAAGR